MTFPTFHKLLPTVSTLFPTIDSHCIKFAFLYGFSNYVNIVKINFNFSF